MSTERRDKENMVKIEHMQCTLRGNWSLHTMHRGPPSVEGGSSPHGGWRPRPLKGVEGFHPPGGEDPLLPAWWVEAHHPLVRPPPTMWGGPTLHGGWASVHGVQRPVSLEYQI